MTEESKAPEAPAPAAAPGPKPVPQEGPTLFGGRMLGGIVLLIGIAVVAPQGMNAWLDRKIHPTTPKPTVAWTVGGEANIELTLITADSRRLHCAHDGTVENTHCGFTANKRPWPKTPGAVIDDNDENVIQPYRTADANALVLVSGLWAQPELAMRVHREPPFHYEADKQLRFVAYCRVRFIGEMKDASLRWETGGKWHDNQSALVATPLHCTLEAPSG